MSALPDSAYVFDITAPVKPGAKHIDVEHVEHVEDTAAALGLLCQAQAQACSTPTELVLPLSQLVPQDFAPYYDERAYENDADRREGRRPRYTQRNLLDWEKNDLRSLLFVPELRAEWEGQLPVVAEPGYRVVLLPLDASNAQLVQTLVDSDLYKEQCMSHADREAIARVAVDVARNGAPPTQALSRPEWRHMIENYLLNLGCEVQTRHDYRALVTQLKNAKRSTHGHAAVLTVEERIAIWKSCQQSLYRRLRLDWRPDEF